jgi:hypothetical protein
LKNFNRRHDVPVTGCALGQGSVAQSLYANTEGKMSLLVSKASAAEAAVLKGLQPIRIQNLLKAAGFSKGK